MIHSKAHYALIHAAIAHDRVQQRRKHANHPYIVHPIEVGTLLREAGETDDVIAAGYLHDVIEDTTDNRVEAEAGIRQLFGDRVADIVMEVTETTTLEDGNRQTRKAIERDRLACASPAGQTVKLADIISNCRDIIETNPGFARVYVGEKLEDLKVLRKGNPVLYTIASDLLTHAGQELGLTISRARRP